MAFLLGHECVCVCVCKGLESVGQFRCLGCAVTVGGCLLCPSLHVPHHQPCWGLGVLSVPAASSAFGLCVPGAQKGSLRALSLVGWGGTAAIWQCGPAGTRGSAQEDPIFPAQALP